MIQRGGVAYYELLIAIQFSQAIDSVALMVVAEVNFMDEWNAQLLNMELENAF